MSIFKNSNERTRWALIAIDFLKSIGLHITIKTAAPVKSFLPHVRIVDGGLEVDTERVFPGDILHEAGHLATIPEPFRAMAAGDLKAVRAAMALYLDEHPEGLAQWPEDPVCRAIFQSGDEEATAWQYAAARAISLPEKWLFPEGSYEGEAVEVLHRLQSSQYSGINGLQAAGWTLVRKNPWSDVPVFPTLAFWLHPGAKGASVAVAPKKTLR